MFEHLEHIRTLGHNLRRSESSDVGNEGPRLIPQATSPTSPPLSAWPIHIPNSPKATIVTREVWQFAEADWECLVAAFALHSWSEVCIGDVHDGARVNTRVLEFVQAKHRAEGTDREAECGAAPSRGILEEYHNYEQGASSLAASSKREERVVDTIEASPPEKK